MINILYRWMVFVGLLILIADLTGCATKNAQIEMTPITTQNTKTKVDKTEPVTDIKKNVGIEEVSDEYEVVLTPFGYVKKRVAPSRTNSGPFKSGTNSPESSIEHQMTKVSPEKVVDQKRLLTKEIENTGNNHRKENGDNNVGPIVLNFDNADLYEVVRTFAEILNFNYIVDEGIQGKVTIHMSRGMNKEDLWPIFYQILEINGLTAVSEDKIYKIVNLKKAARFPLRYRIGLSAPQIPPSERIVIQIIPLKHISTGEMTTLLNPFISEDGMMVAHDKTNTLILVDKGVAILKAIRMVEAFDIDLFKRFKNKFYTINHVDSKDMAKMLEDILSGYDGQIKQKIKLIPIERLNLILAICNDGTLLRQVEGFIASLDVPSDEAESKIYIYFLQNSKVDELEPLLESIFGSNSEEEAIKQKNGGKADNNKGYHVTDFGNPLIKKETDEGGQATKEQRTDRGSQQSLSQVKEGSTSTLRGELKITSDSTRNALIIEAVPSDYRIVENIIKKIDILPRQVLIEVTIAEITLDDNTELGVEWDYTKENKAAKGLDTSIQQATMGSTGFFYEIGMVDRWSQTLTALATENKVKFLASPSILASDNKEANINISSEIPVASTEYQYNSGNDGVFETNIQYRNTGLILSVTPHINDGGIVSMDINQEFSKTDESIAVGDQSYTSFKKRTVKTTLTVGHGQTIVIGGLIQEDKNETDSGVPLLKDIPFLKYFAGKKTKSKIRSELVILITPRVITSLEDVDSVTKDFQSKVQYDTNYRKQHGNNHIR